MLNHGRYGFLNRQWSFRCWSWGCTNVGAGPYNSLCRHLPSSSHRENFCSNCVLRSISILKRSQEIGLRRHPAWIPPNVEGGSLRWKPNTRKELSKATEKGERLGFFEELRNPKRPLPCVAGLRVARSRSIAQHHGQLSLAVMRRATVALSTALRDNLSCEQAILVVLQSSAKLLRISEDEKLEVWKKEKR